MREPLHIPAYRHKADSTVSYGDPAHWQHPEQWEPVHVLTDDELAQVQARALIVFADSTRFPNDWILFRRDDGSGVTVSDLLREAAANYRREHGKP